GGGRTLGGRRTQVRGPAQPWGRDRKVAALPLLHRVTLRACRAADVRPRRQVERGDHPVSFAAADRERLARGGSREVGPGVIQRAGLLAPLPVPPLEHTPPPHPPPPLA